MTPYVGMNEKQDGGYIQCISIQTLTFLLVMNFIRPKTPRSGLSSYSSKEIVTKVTNLETVKIEFRHLRFFFSISFFHSPSAFTRAVPIPNTHEQS